VTLQQNYRPIGRNSLAAGALNRDPLLTTGIWRTPMSDHVYSITEIVGSSSASLDDAIKTGVTTAAKSLRNLEWFEVTQIRGQIVDGAVKYYQVQMKLGLRYEPKQ
jgi:flavin-binding protein dodecin